MKKSSKSYGIYVVLCVLCVILLFYNIIRTDSWTGDMPFSQFTESEWRLFYIFIIEELMILVFIFVFGFLGCKNMNLKGKQERYLDGLLIKGLVDARKLAGFANARKLPYGETGLCLMCLKDNFLNVYSTNIQQDVGDLFYTVDLKKVKNLKTSVFVLNSYIKFTYEGFDYKLVDCIHKELYKAIESEVL